MKYKIGDDVKMTFNGYYFCSPEVWNGSHDPTLHTKVLRAYKKYYDNFIIINHQVAKGYNWYQLEKNGNWYTEEGLELVKKENLPFKVGTLLNYNGTKVSFVGNSPHSFVAEVVTPETWGWRRDDDVPKDYQSKYTNLYLCIHGNEPLWKEPISEPDKTTGFKEPVPEIGVNWITTHVSVDKFETNPCKNVATGLEPHYTAYFNRQIKVVYSEPDEQLQKPVDINKKKKSKILVHS